MKRAVPPISFSDGDWTIDRISPPAGPTSTKTLVSLTGEFPDSVYVWFGDQPGEVVYQSGSWILVTTPDRAEAGPVDVELRRNSRTLTVPQGFTFFDPTTGEGPVAGPGGSGAGGSGSGSGSTPDPEADPDLSIDEPTGTTVAAPTPGGTDPADGSPVSDNGPSKPKDTDKDTDKDSGKDSGKDGAGPHPQRQARAAVLGDPVDLGNGLRGTPLSGLETVGGVPRCSSDPCRTKRR